MNESILQFVSAPYTQNLVTKESCIAYVQSTMFWNKVFIALLIIMIVYTLYLTFKDKIREGIKSG